MLVIGCPPARPNNMKTKRATTFVETIPFGDHFEVERHRFENGLTALIMTDRSAPVISYQTWYRVGSRHEKRGKTGLAHLFEHLMFNETKSLPRGEFDRLLESAGGETNAATWVDWTYYYENVPREEIGLVVRLEADRMTNLVLRDPQVKSEKEVVANERRFRVDDEVEGSVNELLYKTAFTKHPYHWPTIGWMADIERFTTADCREFYGTYYAPNNAVVVMVGDITVDEALKILHSRYDAIGSSKIPRERVVHEPPQTKERIVRIRKPTQTQKLQLGYRAPAFGERKHAILSVANEILFGGRSSRLVRALVTEGEVAAEARGSVAPSELPGLYEIWVSMRDRHTANEALAIIDAEFERLASSLVKPSELEKVKNRMELGFLQGLETASGKAEQIGFYEVVTGDPRRVFERVEAMRSVTRDEIRSAVANLLVPRARTRIHVEPNAPVRAKADGSKSGKSATRAA